MSSKTLISSIVFLFIATTIFSQNKKLTLANEKYEKMAYMDAARLYETVLKRDVGNQEILTKIGNSYYYNSKFTEANKWYSKLFDINKNQDEQTLLRYIQVLKVLGDFEKIEALASVGITEENMESKIDSVRNSSAYFFNYNTNQIKIAVEDAGINSQFSDYGGVQRNDNLIFTSSRKITGSSKAIHEWTNSPFSNLFQAEEESGKFIKPKTFLTGISTKYNESTAVFTKDGNTMYFTRNEPLKTKKSKDENPVIRLKLYKATYQEEKWVDFEELPFNSNKYNCAHPVLSLDEHTLYFVSDMPGSMGASDLFSVKINDDESFGNPKNLGDKINTVGRETFPFISKKNELFFSSDEHFGIGGLDIFVSKIKDNASFETPQNLGEPINGSNDDFAFFLNQDNSNGFFSSNREGGKGADDIYRFTIEPIFDENNEIPKKVITRSILLNGTVKDAVNKETLQGVKVMLYDIETKKLLAQTSTNKEGNYSLNIDKNLRYRIDFKFKTHTQIQRQLESFSLGESVDSIRRDATMEPILDAKVLANLNKIYFNSNDSYIKNAAALELDKLVTLMLKTYPEMIIKIEAHTDPVGTNIYNDWLSQKRAESTYKYLISNGINKNRIASYIGFGKRKPVNKCTGPEDCTPSELKLNRRTEFPIVKIRNPN